MVSHRCTFEDCDYETALSGNLEAHLRTHTREKPFKCTYPGCSYSATQAAGVVAHQRVHRRGRIYPCPCCDEDYLCQSDRLSHLKAVHNMDSCWFPCPSPLCDFRARNPNVLESHYHSKHSATRPFSCPNCRKLFAVQRNMGFHLKMVHALLGEEQEKEEMPARKRKKKVEMSGEKEDGGRGIGASKPTVCGRAKRRKSSPVGRPLNEKTETESLFRRSLSP
ncbi:hypothetical protein CYLTODRAFT_420305 [Cylindrobasidium torrendii FP15055 ss-10]|uniref:C2H2-type domain-containing protein n=1 Tax=Cylindrobasidium torrendii FP15055 ss-10 TaxID=1314674 RepID=A0A0D7BJR8_9AGAR|nr:hypothetical protein CYLTODRAFT_420305 [Cylindrobasidium torrendii FP15055 ss-10]